MSLACRHVAHATVAFVLMLGLVACDDKKDGEEAERTSYDFAAATSVQLKSTGAGLRPMSSLSGLPLANSTPPMCQDNLCFTPTNLTGKYYGVALLIQSTGNGMLAYFGQDSWSAVTGTSTSYAFDFQTPVTQTGNMICCSGEGDLADGESYIEDVAYLFGYVDATFEIPEASGAHGDAVGIHTIRFVLADDAVAGAKRGDLLYSDAGIYKWMSAGGVLSVTRPDDAVTMNASVVSWQNPFGEKGNQEIPVLYTSLEEPSGGGKTVVTDTDLQIVGRTYAFDFNASGFIAFPTLLKADVGMLDSRLAIMSKIHIQGLPHSQYQMGKAGTTTLSITGP